MTLVVHEFMFFMIVGRQFFDQIMVFLVDLWDLWDIFTDIHQFLSQIIGGGVIFVGMHDVFTLFLTNNLQMEVIFMVNHHYWWRFLELDVLLVYYF